MALIRIERIFKFESKGLELPDPNPQLSKEQVLQFYANTYPELTTASVQGPSFENDKAVFKFITVIGTKG